MTANESGVGQRSRLQGLITESSNPAMADLDSLDILERLRLMNAEDAKVANAVASELPLIAKAVLTITNSMRLGGRLIYVGAGTSGRLGVLDASECPPTFGTETALVTAIIAGGPSAMFAAVEGAEDDPEQGIDAIDSAGVSGKDTVVGISASGQAPFVLAALKRSQSLGAATISVTNNRPSELERYSDICIAPIVGPEVIAGSTRMKSGTAQKMVLNLLSTNAMIEMGKTYGNLMVDVKATNSKLRARALRITCEVTGASEEAALKALDQCDGSAKLAILVIETGLSVDEATKRLKNSHGFLRRALANSA